MSETIRLCHPIRDDNDELIEEVTVRRPTVSDIEKRETAKSDMKRSIYMIADLTELSPDTVRKLDVADFNAISTAVGEFTGGQAE